MGNPMKKGKRREKMEGGNAKMEGKQSCIEEEAEDRRFK